MLDEHLGQKGYLQGFLSANILNGWVNDGLSVPTRQILTSPGIVEAANVNATMSGVAAGTRCLTSDKRKFGSGALLRRKYEPAQPDVSALSTGPEAVHMSDKHLAVPDAPTVRPSFATRLADVARHPEMESFLGIAAVFTFFVLFGGSSFVTPAGPASWTNVAPKIVIVALPISQLMIAGELDILIGSVIPGASIRCAVISGYQGLLNRICDMAEVEGVTFTLENLNLLDHPGCPVGSTADVLALVSSVNRPLLRINLDL